MIDKLFARSKAGDLQRGEWPASGTRRTGDENGDGDLESRPLSVVDDDDVDNEGRDEDQLSPDNPEVVASGECALSSKSGTEMRVGRGLRRGARSGEVSSRWNAWSGSFACSSEYESARERAVSSTILTSGARKALSSNRLMELATHLRSSCFSSPAASRCASMVNCERLEMAGERLIGIECGPRGEMGVSGGRGRTSNTGAGGNRGAAGVAASPFDAPKRGPVRVELRFHVLALLRSPRLKARAMGEGDGKGRLRGLGRLSGGGVVAVEHPVRVGVAGRGAIRCVEGRVVPMAVVDLQGAARER